MQAFSDNRKTAAAAVGIGVAAFAFGFAVGTASKPGGVAKTSNGVKQSDPSERKTGFVAHSVDEKVDSVESEAQLPDSDDVLLCDVAELEEAAKRASSSPSSSPPRSVATVVGDSREGCGLETSEEDKLTSPPSNSVSREHPSPDSLNDRHLNANRNGSTPPPNQSRDGGSSGSNLIERGRSESVGSHIAREVHFGLGYTGGVVPVGGSSAVSLSGSANPDPAMSSGSIHTHPNPLGGGGGSASTAALPASGPALSNSSSNTMPSATNAPLSSDHPLHQRMSALKMSMLASSGRSELLSTTSLGAAGVAPTTSGADRFAAHNTVGSNHSAANTLDSFSVHATHLVGSPFSFSGNNPNANAELFTPTPTQLANTSLVNNQTTAATQSHSTNSAAPRGAPNSTSLSARRPSGVYHSADGGILSQAAFTYRTFGHRIPQWPIWRICVTGGPCSGKSTSMPLIKKELESCGFRVYIVPEVATLLINGGLEFSNMTREKRVGQQTVILQTIMMLEDSFYELAKGSMQPSLILCDRGTLDGSAYCSAQEFEEILSVTGYTIAELRDARYDAIVHLVTTAIGAQDAYTTANNEARRESAEEAANLDRLTREKWNGHRLLGVFDNSTTFMEKCDRVVQFIKRIARVVEGPPAHRRSSPTAATVPRGFSSSELCSSQRTESQLLSPSMVPTDVGTRAPEGKAATGQGGHKKAEEGTPLSPTSPPRGNRQRKSTKKDSTANEAAEEDESSPAGITEVPSLVMRDEVSDGDNSNDGGEDAVARSSASDEKRNHHDQQHHHHPPHNNTNNHVNTHTTANATSQQQPHTSSSSKNRAPLASSTVAGVHKRVKVSAIKACGLPPSAVETEYLTLTLAPSQGFKEEKLIRQKTAGGGVVESRRTDTGMECNASTLYFYVAEREESSTLSVSARYPKAAFATSLGSSGNNKNSSSANTSGAGVEEKNTKTQNDNDNDKATPATMPPADSEAESIMNASITGATASGQHADLLVEVSPSTIFAATGAGGEEGDNIVIAGSVGHLRLSSEEFAAIRYDSRRAPPMEMRKRQYTFFDNEKYFTLVHYDYPERKIVLVAPFDCPPSRYPSCFVYDE